MMIQMPGKSYFMGIFLILIAGMTLSGYSNGTDSLTRDNFKKADLIFTGKVIALREFSAINPQEPVMLVEFDVTEIQKGKRRVRVLLTTPPVANENDMFEMGKEYLVYAIFKHTGGKGAGVYTNFRQKTVILGTEDEEMKTLYTIVKKKWFHKVKPPLPKYIIGSGCGC
jgi:hypothetical protein